MYPKISVITVSYNSEKTIEDTILSVISQDYKNLEYIIIDGGSKDKTVQIIQQYEQYLSIWISEPDKGISDAFNKGISYATGDVVGIINSDDILCEGALQTVANSYNEKIDVFRGNMIVWDDENSKEYISIPTMEFPITKRIRSVNHPATFISKRAYDTFGTYCTDMRYMMDADLLYRLFKNKAVFCYLDYPLAKFRLGGTTSDNWKKKLPEFKKMLYSNGASFLVVIKQTLSLSLYCYIKDFMFGVFGAKSIRKFRYKSHEIKS